jgi:hypothetical protein
MDTVRFARAVEKLRLLAEKCLQASRWPPDDPFVRAAYAFGDVLEGEDPLDAVQVEVAVNLTPEEVPWGSNPHGTGWLAEELRLSKGGYEYWWRSHLDPPWNHYVRSPVRVWSLAGGTETATLDALAARRFGDLPRLTPSDADRRLQRRDDLDAALRHLHEVRDKYWDRDWRREHRGFGRYPEHELWEAVEGYLDILDERP